MFTHHQLDFVFIIQILAECTTIFGHLVPFLKCDVVDLIVRANEKTVFVLVFLENTKLSPYLVVKVRILIAWHDDKSPFVTRILGRDAVWDTGPFFGRVEGVLQCSNKIRVRPLFEYFLA